MNQITKIGFYNPQGPKQPLESFTDALESVRNELQGSLLVLPEAFNIGTSYSCRDPIQQDPQIRFDLQALCIDFDICIVAGLIISDPTDNGDRPYSSSWLIDAHSTAPLCHKKLSDTQGPYRTCIDGCDGHNGIAYLNIALCSLICMDAYKGEHERCRHEQLKKKMDAVTNSQCRVICVPAYIETTPPRFWGIPNSYRIVANSASRTDFPKSPGSFIDRIDEHGASRPLVQLEEADKQTCIKLWPKTV